MWQPIETAPKDGKKFMIWNGVDIGVAEWTRNGAAEPLFLYCQWASNDLDYDRNYAGGPSNPTHWMPLPPPPSE